MLLGEQHPAVDHQKPPGELEHRHVAADLTQTAQSDNP
jgi:hypothetical protein